MFAQNFILGPSLYIFDNVDALLFHHLILVLLSNVLLLSLALISQSRYATLATIRAIVHIISLDIFVTVVYVLIILSAQSAQFHEFVIAQEQYWFVLLFLPAAGGFLIILLLEAKRTPFDHIETEAELVAGYQVEYSGPMLMMFYLAEYLHLIIASIHFIICFCGGWLILAPLFFLPPVFHPIHNIDVWSPTFLSIL